MNEEQIAMMEFLLPWVGMHHTGLSDVGWSRETAWISHLSTSPSPGWDHISCCPNFSFCLLQKPQKAQWLHLSVLLYFSLSANKDFILKLTKNHVCFFDQLDICAADSSVLLWSKSRLDGKNLNHCNYTLRSIWIRGVDLGTGRPVSTTHTYS